MDVTVEKSLTLAQDIVLSWEDASMANFRFSLLPFSSYLPIVVPIKLSKKNPHLLCIQTPQKRSGVDSKPIWHLDPLLPRFIYVAWLFNSWSPLCNMVPIIKNQKESISSGKETFCSSFAEFQFK